jgi:hypothetical protein
MAQRCLHAIAALAALVCFGCTRVEPGSSPVRADATELRVTDWDGEPANFDQVPRRPRFIASSAQGLAPTQDALLLFEGPPDPALIDDLTQSPLLREHQARLVHCDLDAAPNMIVLSPNAALPPHASYALALPAWAAQPKSKVARVFRLRTAAGPDAGAQVVASWPAEGAANVGTNLEAVVIAFDGTVESTDAGVWLEGPDGLALAAQVSSGPCQSVAPEQDGSFCVRVAPSTRLAPNAVHTIVVGTEARDWHGAPVGPWRAMFSTAEGSDTEAPALLPLSCAVDEQSIELGCLLIDDESIALRLQADEATTAVLGAGARHAFATAPDGEVSLKVSGLAPDSPLRVELSLRDSSGNQADHELLLRTLAPLATLSITEVRADALGPEPQQELVELLNYGTAPVDLLGFVLGERDDQAGEPIARSMLVAPQTRVLLVGDDFDPNDPHDVAPPPGAPLLRVGRALAGSGLSNRGAPLFLRDPAGHRVSAAPAAPPPRPGVCLVRVSRDMRDGSLGTFDYDANGTCTPGR